MRFSICVIEPEEAKFAHLLYEGCKYLCYGIESAGYDCCILRNKFSPDRVNIVFGAHNLSDPAKVEQIKHTGKYIVLQTEIVTGDTINHWPVQGKFKTIYLPLLLQAQAVWECIESNIAPLKRFGIDADLLLFGYHPRMEEIIHKKNKDIDFLFYGSITAHRKKQIEALMARGGKVVTMFDDAAMYRNDLIARARINLAPHQGAEMNHFGAGRVLYLLNNHSIVVVERCHDQGLFEHCFPFAETEHWVDLCMDTLKRPDLAQITEEYYERFKKIRMVDFIAPLLEKFLSKYESCTTAKTFNQANEKTEPTTSSKESHLSPYFQQETALRGMTSIVVLTHNRLEQTKKCVKSIRKHTPETHEIIFIDNDSTDSTVKWLQGQVKENKNYFLIENKENVGVAKGRNQGINLSQGEFILLLDNDVVVSESWLDSMLKCLKSRLDVGIVGPMSNNAQGIQQVTDDIYSSVDHLDKYAANFKEQYSHRRIPCRNLAGFCMLFKRALAEKIGLLDQRFTTSGFEDEDYCCRSTLEGYKNYIAGDVFIHHTGGKKAPGDRKIIDKKWTLSTATPEGKKLIVLKGQELANDFYQKGQLDQAIEALINCIKVTPDDKHIYYELSRILIESKKFSEAWEVYGTMPETAKNHVKGLEYEGYAKEGLGLDDEADEYAEKMLFLKDDYAPAWNLKGVLAFKTGNREKATEYFQKAAKCDPGYGEAYTNLGVLYWGMDKKEDALAHLEKGFILSPTVPDVSSLYYSVVSSLGTFSDAEIDYREASKLHPNNKNLAFLSIDILIQQAKFNEALIQIQDVLASYGLDEGILNAALTVREKIGPMQIEKTAKKGTLSLCMIVKNEEKHLVKCLRSIRNVVDEIIIVDTGSTDKTIDIAKVFGAKTYEFPWTGDFSTARNESLKYATGDWILVLDADEVVAARDFDELKTIIHKRTASPSAYSIVTRNYMNNTSVIGWTPIDGEYPEEAGSGWVTSAKVRLVPRRKDVFFVNPVHELVEDSLKNAKIPIHPCKIIVHHYGKLDMARDAQKGEDYYLLGKIKYESDPTNLKYIYELAKQSHLLKKYEESVELWLKLLSLIEADPQSPGVQEIAKISYGDPLSEIYTQLSASYLLLDRYYEALTLARKAMETSVKLKEYVFVYAHCEIIAGSLEKALQALEELLQTTPDYPPALLMKAVIFCLTDKKDEYQELFEIFRERKISISLNLNTIAQQLQLQGKRNEALLILNATIESKMNNMETMRLLEELQKEQ